MNARRLDPPAVNELRGPAGGIEVLLRDPFAWLGPHPSADGSPDGSVIVRAMLPQAVAVEAMDAGAGGALARLEPAGIDGLFAGRLPAGRPAGQRYFLRIQWPGGVQQDTEDPYSFGLLLGDMDLYLIAEGKHREIATCLGAQRMTIGGVSGVRFAVWAPNARRVSVVGAFNGWDGRRHPMRLRLGAGVWELFVPRLAAGTLYKYEIQGPRGMLPLKADPVGLEAEPPPGTASVVAEGTAFAWTDQEWMRRRAQGDAPRAPISIYEVHAGSWRRDGGDNGRSLHWDELGDQLVPYVNELGFTHIELLPVMAHPFGGSWGYQPLGLFAPHAPFGAPAAFARFVDRCHAAGIGVILDWVPAHFPTDEHGLMRFDGTALYEHEDPREGFQQDWNTLIYNLGRREVHGFLIASALHWLEHYHIDGLRVDAVASMLYRDYSRSPGEWIPNRYGGRENLEAVEFLRDFNDAVAQRCPGAITLAEESTSWPGVTHATAGGGLGFSFKWNMGWMHDTLRYISRDPVYRSHEHDKITFGLLYAFSERFVLPLSHDEVVHGKGSLIGKMPGDRWQKFANLRTYLSFMWTQPGKKLLFMGCEFAQQREWNHDRQLDWELLQDPLNSGMQKMLADLNRLYRSLPALHRGDCDGAGFRWIVVDDREHSVFAYCRFDDGGAPPLLAVLNFTPVPRQGYRIGVPRGGYWHEVFNSDARLYGGSGMGNAGGAGAAAQASHGMPFSLSLTVPPLAALLLVAES